MNNHLTIEMKSQGWVDFATIKNLLNFINFNELKISIKSAMPEDSEGGVLFFSIKCAHNLKIAWGHLFDDWLYLKDDKLNWDIERAIFMVEEDN